MVRECKPPAREPVRSWLSRRLTMVTPTPANAYSTPNISPVGPPQWGRQQRLFIIDYSSLKDVT